MNVFRPATLGGIEVSKNVANYKSTAETALGALVILNDNAKTFTTVASVEQAKEGVYALWQNPNAENHSVRGDGTNSYKLGESEYGRLLYLPALFGIKDGVEMGGDIIVGTHTKGVILVANAAGKYEATGDASEYAISFVVQDVIEEYDFTRYVCEVVPGEDAVASE